MESGYGIHELGTLKLISGLGNNKTSKTDREDTRPSQTGNAEPSSTTGRTPDRPLYTALTAASPRRAPSSHAKRRRGGGQPGQPQPQPNPTKRNGWARNRLIQPTHTDLLPSETTTTRDLPISHPPEPSTCPLPDSASRGVLWAQPQPSRTSCSCTHTLFLRIRPL